MKIHLFKLTFVCAVLSLIGCANADQAVPKSMPPEINSSVDGYYDYLDDLVELYWADEYQKVLGLVNGCPSSYKMRLI